MRYDDVFMATVNLSFSRYVAACKGAGQTRARETAAYAFGGDLRVRASMDKLRPMTLAMESAVRFWNTVGKSRLVGSAVLVGERQFPALFAKVARCADVLHIPLPAVYVSPELASLGAHTFGTSDDATLVLSGALVDHLSEAELLFVIGHECGHIQNNHVVYLTALYYLTQTANVILRLGAQPVVLALRAWSRRAEITSDRAGLLCTRDLGTATAALIKLALGSRKLYADINVDEYLRQFAEARDDLRRLGEAFSTHPYLPTRVTALRLFAQTAYFRGVAGDGAGTGGPGLSREECDTQVADLLAVLR
ncbi:MAG TPA: M48 family metallopeptidase [Polyangia bacterium]|jgi:Zn-dependent protease with chaperone function|nr:M48 family metallopeptidase [Polyangia bacterium]